MASRYHPRVRILYLANNRIGLDCLKVLLEQGDTLAGLVLHPSGKAKFRDEMLALAGLPADRVIPGDRIREPGTEARVRDLKPDAILSVHFGYRIGAGVLRVAPKGAFNLHPGYLPYNRGLYPNVWALAEGTPAGVTLHRMDENFDTGPVVARRRTDVLATDTGESLYHRLEETALALFREAWPTVRAGTFRESPQEPGGTRHNGQDLPALDRLDPDQRMTVRELVDRLRARTFPPYPGCYLEEKDGRRVYLRLWLGEKP